MDYKEQAILNILWKHFEIADKETIELACSQILATLPSETEIAKGLWDKYIYDVEHRGYSYDFGTWMSLYWLKERK